MKQDDRDLLLKDLCGRLPYGVKIQFSYIFTSPAILKGINKDLIECDIAVCELEDVKPYLFPLSSMTEEQYKEYTDMGYSVTERWWSMANYHQIEWLDKNHFDYRGLIPKGLAKDATNLNVY